MRMVKQGRNKLKHECKRSETDPDNINSTMKDLPQCLSLSIRKGHIRMKVRSVICILSILLSITILNQTSVLAADGVDGYRINTGDALGIEVHGIEVQGLSALTGGDLPPKVTVRPDGTISYPYVGTVEAAGKTEFELADVIQNSLLERFKRAWVKVTVVEYNKSRSVKVFGEIANPGTFPINGGRSFLELVTEVGKMGPKADIEHIKLISADGKIRIINFNEIIENPFSENNVQMSSGDIVHVPAVKEESKEESQPIRVMLMGAIGKQGPVYLNRDHSTIIDAIFENGGMTEGKFKEDIYVIRATDGGDPETIRIDLEKAITTRDSKYNITLVEDDYVYIPAKKQKFIHRVNDVIDLLNPAVKFRTLFDAVFDRNALVL